MRIILTSLLSLPFMLGGSAFAQIITSPMPVDDKQDNEATEIYAGAAVLSSQNFIGADETEFRVLPYFSIYNYKGFDFRPFALSYDLVDIQKGDGIWATGLKAGAQASYNFSRDEDEGDALTGLGDVGGALLAGGYGILRLGPVALRVEGGQDIIDGHGGAQFDMSLGTRIPLGDASITAALTRRWGSEDYNQAYFGVTSEQASTSVYNTALYSSGVFSNGGTVLLSYPIGDKWDFTALASHQVYTDSVIQSPILQATGAESATTALLAISRKFTLGN